MADVEPGPTSRLGFLPRVLLWSLVLLFAFLYLGAIEPVPPSASHTPSATPREAGSAGDRVDALSAIHAVEPAPALAEDSPTTDTPAPVDGAGPETAPGDDVSVASGDGAADGRAAGEPSGTGEAAAGDAVAERPAAAVSEAEANAFANALLTSEPGSVGNTANEAGSVPADRPVPDPSPASATVSKAPGPSGATGPAAVSAGSPSQAPGPDATGPDTDYLFRGDATGTDSSAAVATPSGRPLPDLVAERERVAAQYAEMQRQAMEEARRRWEAVYGQLPPQGPVGAPYEPPYPEWFPSPPYPPPVP